MSGRQMNRKMTLTMRIARRTIDELLASLLRCQCASDIRYWQEDGLYYAEFKTVLP